jgi:hypothetical protein
LVSQRQGLLEEGSGVGHLAVWRRVLGDVGPPSGNFKLTNGRSEMVLIKSSELS